MASLLCFSAKVLGFCLWVSVISPAHSEQASCTSQRFTDNHLYAHCLDLPALASFLHFTFNKTNSTLSISFIASPSKPDGWVSWAINPTMPKMPASQALVAYKDSKGAVNVKTYNISGYSPDTVVQSKLAFDVWDTRGEEESGAMRIFAKIKVPADLAAKGTVNHVWQVGPSVQANGRLTPHEMGGPNMNSVGVLDFKAGQGVAAGGDDSRTRKKNIHGILNAVSWGFLFPFGIVIARYLRTFPSADPAWFYLHASCQVSAYVLGVAGWGTGMKLGSESSGMQFTGHRNIGIALFVFATLQIFALFLRPNKDHKYRLYWNIYHHSVGYAILVLGIFNVFKGLDMLQPAQKWRWAYVVLLVVLGAIAALLEIITWIVVMRRRSSKSTKPYDGYSGHGARPFTT